MKNIWKSLFIFFLLNTSILAVAGDADTYVEITEDGEYMSGTDIYGNVIFGKTTRKSVISCLEVKNRLDVYLGILERYPTGHAQYNSAYKKADKYERIYVYECK